MAICVSLINMKGGVGKTTIATQLAQHATNYEDKRVLLVDLDPQANASQTLLGADRYIDMHRKGDSTVVDIFEEFASPLASSKRVRTEEVIKIVLAYAGRGVLHVVPSRLELSQTLRNPFRKEDLLERFLNKISSEYDLILLDCPPTDSILTDAAYLCSRFVLVPMQLKFLASIGLDLLQRSLNAFRQRYEHRTIEVCGLVFNDHDRKAEMREQQLAREDILNNATRYNWYVFQNSIAHSESYLRAVREGTAIGDTRHARWAIVDEFDKFAYEFYSRIGLNVKKQAAA